MGSERCMFLYTRMRQWRSQEGGIGRPSL